MDVKSVHREQTLRTLDSSQFDAFGTIVIVLQEASLAPEHEIRFLFAVIRPERRSFDPAVIRIQVIHKRYPDREVNWR
jgi:hypothetical protein